MSYNIKCHLNITHLLEVLLASFFFLMLLLHYVHIAVTCTRPKNRRIKVKPHKYIYSVKLEL